MLDNKKYISMGGLTHYDGKIKDYVDNEVSILEESVNTSLGYVERTDNKVQSLSSASTATQYPSAKAVYDVIGNVESLLASI